MLRLEEGCLILLPKDSGHSPPSVFPPWSPRGFETPTSHVGLPLPPPSLQGSPQGADAALSSSSWALFSCSVASTPRCQLELEEGPQGEESQTLGEGPARQVLVIWSGCSEADCGGAGARGIRRLEARPLLGEVPLPGPRSEQQEAACPLPHQWPLMAGPHREQLTLQNWDVQAQPQGHLTEQRRTIWSWDVTAQ